MEKEQKLEIIFDELAEELNITETMLKKAETAYTALGEHIKNTNQEWDVSIYPQGSFELGTVIKPLNEDEQYDVDLVILVKSPIYNAEELRTQVRAVLESHGRYEGKIQDKKPCIRIQYANSSQFHMDIASAKNISEITGSTVEIARYDGETSYYYDLSNPKGYVKWFKEAMRYTKVIKEFAKLNQRATTDVEELTLTKIRTPLQKAIQILKRHRDIYFSENGNSEFKPSSIIITTLCALSYESLGLPVKDKENVYTTIVNMLNAFPNFIKINQTGEFHLENPSFPSENFLKKWKTEPRLKETFNAWIDQARLDIITNPEQFIEEDPKELRATFQKAFGEATSDRVFNQYGQRMGNMAQDGIFKYNMTSANITTNASDKSYKKHTYFGG